MFSLNFGILKTSLEPVNSNNQILARLQHASSTLVNWIVANLKVGAARELKKKSYNKWGINEWIIQNIILHLHALPYFPFCYWVKCIVCDCVDLQHLPYFINNSFVEWWMSYPSPSFSLVLRYQSKFSFKLCVLHSDMISFSYSSSNSPLRPFCSPYPTHCWFAMLTDKIKFLNQGCLVLKIFPSKIQLLKI